MRIPEMRISEWSLLRVCLLCAAWVLGAPVLALLGFRLGAWWIARRDVETPYYARFDLGGWAAAALLLLPPAVVVGAWLYARWRDG